MTDARDIRRLSLPGCETSENPFSQIVLDGTYAFLSGVVASDLPGGPAVLGDIAQETALVMAAIRDELAYVGVGMDRIVRVDVHLVDIGRITEFDTAYIKYFPEGSLPARTCTQSGGLAGGSSVEITVMARVPA